MEVKLIYNHDQKTLAFDPMDLHLMGLTLKKKSRREHRPFNLYLKAQGLFNLWDRHLDVPQFHLGMNDILQLNGRLNSSFGPQPNLMLEGLNGSLSPQKLLPFLPDRIRERVAPFHLSGRVGIHGDVQGLRHQQKWRLHYNLRARFNQNPFYYRTAQIRSNGKITGSIQAEGRFPDMEISVRMNADETIFLGKGVKTKPFKVSLSLSGKHPIYRIKGLAVHIPRANVLVGEKDILVDDIQVQIQKGRLGGEKKSLFFPEIRFDSSLLKNLLFSLEVDGGHLILELEGEDVHLIESALALNLLPSTWQFSGLDSIQIRVTQKEKGDWLFTAKLGIQEFGFQNQDASWLGEKVSLAAKMDGELDLKRSLMTAHTAIEVTRGEILLDRFYLNLNSNMLFSSSEGRYDIPNKSLQLSHLTLGLNDILTLDLNGTLERKDLDRRVHLSLNIPKTSLEPLFHHFILEPFKTEKPILSALNLGGTISADLKLIGSGVDWIVMGY
ncbi:MAG: hypothetical protein QGG48_10460, partial [Desulfatiglandales bacterium]|nr:hypothetical protein [Desulfatiglandales bacterium]